MLPVDGCFRDITSFKPVLAGCEAEGCAREFNSPADVDVAGTGADTGAGAGVSKDNKSTRAAGLAGSGALTGGGWECGRG